MGRCADHILHERLDCLHVFICADSTSRDQRILDRHGDNGKPVQKRIEEKDTRRKIYYSHYTDQVWGAPQNYHLGLNSSAVGKKTALRVKRRRTAFGSRSFPNQGCSSDRFPLILRPQPQNSGFATSLRPDIPCAPTDRL
ncbi:cytidylate kinase family protein [Oscillospiraceae bacterium 21-37]|uniref:cytidylate kinase-like family protein n=1 Tax=Acutalibacter sp. JLR.KK004 TaxID=3112622 RepID=UPI002FF389D8